MDFQDITNDQAGWAISTGSKRDIAKVEQLKDGAVGISRIGRRAANLPEHTRPY